jgi:hypothetical protein
MSILSKFLSVFRSFGRLFSSATKSVPGSASVASSVAASVAVSATAAPATAVAGFVYRVHIDRFFLASRLKSVAKLNTPAGRKPRCSKLLSPYAPAVPADRVGAKKVRNARGRDLRVLGQIQARNARSAEIIPFPVARRDVPSSVSVAKAA